MAAVETCDLCGRSIGGVDLPRRVLGRVYCPSCDRERVRDLNRRDRVPALWFVAIVHTAFTVFLLASGTVGAVRWWAARSVQPEETSIVDLFSAAFLFPVAGIVAWVSWNLWRLEGRGRLTAIFVDALLSVACLYWILNGREAAFLGVFALLSLVYLARGSAADRFW